MGVKPQPRRLARDARQRGSTGGDSALQVQVQVAVTHTSTGVSLKLGPGDSADGSGPEATATCSAIGDLSVGITGSDSLAGCCHSRSARGDFCGPFSLIPVFLVRHIAALAGSPVPEGYSHRGAIGSRHLWAALAQTQASSCGGIAGMSATSSDSEVPATSSSTIVTTSAAQPAADGLSVPVVAPPSAPGVPASTGRFPYRWNEAPLPHLPPGQQGSALAATCTDFCEYLMPFLYVLPIL